VNLELFISNDNVLTLVGLQNSDTAAYLNAATVTVTLVDSDGTDVAGVTWPLSMGYVAASDGKYKVILPDTITGLTAEDALTAKITADGGVGLQGYWEIPLTAKTRVD
jgi:hypothetical protein